MIRSKLHGAQPVFTPALSKVLSEQIAKTGSEKDVDTLINYCHSKGKIRLAVGLRCVSKIVTGQLKARAESKCVQGTHTSRDAGEPIENHVPMPAWSAFRNKMNGIASTGGDRYALHGRTKVETMEGSPIKNREQAYAITGTAKDHGRSELLGSALGPARPETRLLT